MSSPVSPSDELLAQPVRRRTRRTPPASAGGDPFTASLPAVDVGNGALLGWLGTDAVRWARLFEQRGLVDDGDRLGVLIGWFANAIEAGRGQGQRELGAAVQLIRAQEALNLDLLGGGELAAAEAQFTATQP